MTFVCRGLLGPIATLFLLSSALSGCLGAGDEESLVRVSGTVSASPDANAGNVSAEAGANVSFEPPVASFSLAFSNASQTNLTVGTDLIFNGTSSSDPSGGNLSYAWDFGDNATAEGDVVNHSFAAEGNYTVLLAVSSDKSGLESNYSQVLVVLGPPDLGRSPLTFTDPSGDGTTNYHDFRVVTISDDEAVLSVQFTLGGVQPAADQEQLVCYSIFLKGAGATEEHRYETYSHLGAWYLYDYKGGGDLKDGKVKIVGTGYLVTMPLAAVTTDKNFDFPLQIRLESRSGECWQVGGNSRAIGDLAPNTGSVTYG